MALPGKHHTLGQCWFNVGPNNKPALAQRVVFAGSALVTPYTAQGLTETTLQPKLIVNNESHALPQINALFW